MPLSPPAAPSRRHHHRRTSGRSSRGRQRWPTTQPRVARPSTDTTATRSAALPGTYRRARRLVVVRTIPAATTTDQQLVGYQHHVEAETDWCMEKFVDCEARRERAQPYSSTRIGSAGHRPTALSRRTTSYVSRLPNARYANGSHDRRASPVPPRSDCVETGLPLSRPTPCRPIEPSTSWGAYARNTLQTAFYRDALIDGAFEQLIERR
jgi:hypothetical protein